MAGITDLTVGMTGAEFRTAFNSNFAIQPKIYNVKDYGAKGDGVTDDTVAIQTTINTCYAAGEGKVRIPAGIYIIAGALQNAVGDDALDYNSQLYIPASPAGAFYENRTIVIEGDVPSPYFINWSSGIAQYGTVLKSTITGSGIFPSVIGSMGPTTGYGNLNYTDCHVKNLVIMTKLGANGPTVGGINFIRTSSSIIDEVLVTTDFTSYTMPQPINKVFGIGLGFFLDNFPRIGRANVQGGYYYGFVLGEGVHCHNITVTRSYIGILSLTNVHYNYIDFATLHWNTYHVAVQDETIYGKDIYTSYLQIDKGSCENDEEPAWSHTTAMVLDTANKLIGSWRSDYKGILPMTKSGGANFLMYDARQRKNIPMWTTATRPTAYRNGVVGFNETTSKLEVYDGTTWVDLH